MKIVSRAVIVLTLALATGCVGSSSFNALGPRTTGAAVLPDVTLADLDGREYSFPADFAGAPTLLVFGFAHAQRETAAAWMTALAPVLAAAPAVKAYKVPVIDTGNIAIRTIIRNAMRSRAPTDAARRETLTLFVDQQEFTARLGLDAGSPAAVLFAADGTPVWRGIGAPTPEALAGLGQQLATFVNRKD